MIQLAYCAMEWTDYGVRVVFPDGKEMSAWPSEEHHYYVISHRCGYEDSITTYCREHELAHALIAEETYGWASSVQLNSSAGPTAILEEAAVQVLQRFVRGGERPIIGDFNWDALKARFLHLAALLDAEVAP